MTKVERAIKKLVRAQQMLQIAAEYIENHWPDATEFYDGTDCDGYCIAEDCKCASSELQCVLEQLK